jgi:O-antigen ligase
MSHTARPLLNPPEDATPLAASVCVGLGGLLLFFAPLIRGGNRGVALIALEWLSLALLLAVLWLWLHGRRAAWGQGATRWALLALAGAPLWVALVQLTPLPPDLWAALPGRAFYREILSGLGLPVSVWRPASLLPDATAVSVLAGLPLVACFALGLVCPKERLAGLFRVCIAAALLQAVWGLAQLGGDNLLHFDAFFTGVIGSFANSNHFAGFLAMTAPLVVWEWWRSLQGRAPGRAWLWGAALLLMLVAVLVTRSRAGLAVCLLSTALALLLLPADGQGVLSLRTRLLLLGGLLLAALLAAGVQGFRGFGADAMSRGLSARQSMLVETWAAAQVFWPLGSGLGTFAGIYPRFQEGIPGRNFVEHAHSDYVQLLMETGLLGAMLGLLALALLVLRWQALLHKLWRAGGLRREEVSMLAAGLGLLALLLHAWVDFNLRIPALAMLGSFFFGVFLRRRRHEVSHERVRE